MYDFLKPSAKGVIEGMEKEETIFAKNQPEYLPLPALVGKMPSGKVITRWTLTDEQRLRVSEGADIFLELFCGDRPGSLENPLTPIRMAVSDGKLNHDWVRHELLDEP